MSQPRGSNHMASSDWEYHISNSIDCFYGTSGPFLELEAPGRHMLAEPKKINTIKSCLNMIID